MNGLSVILLLAKLNSKARREGNAAFFADVALVDCPYTGAEARAHWERGWLTGSHGVDYSGRNAG